MNRLSPIIAEPDKICVKFLFLTEILTRLRYDRPQKQERVIKMSHRKKAAAQVTLLLAGAAAAVWIGWGRCGKDELRTRLLMLFPLAAALGFMVLGKCFPSQSVYDRVAATVKDLSGFTLFNYVVEHVVWDEMLVLLPVLYFLARCILRRHGDGAKLLGPVAFRWALAGWAASLLIEIPRWLVVTPRLAAYVENGIFSDPAISAAYTNAARWFAVLRWGVIAATVVLAALAERKKAAEAPQQAEDTGEMK